MNHIAPWHVEHQCATCNAGWVCETHPGIGWPHDECPGPGVPCAGLLAETAVWEAEARARLGDEDA